MCGRTVPTCPQDHRCHQTRSQSDGAGEEPTSPPSEAGLLEQEIDSLPARQESLVARRLASIDVWSDKGLHPRPSMIRMTSSGW